MVASILLGLGFLLLTPAVAQAQSPSADDFNPESGEIVRSIAVQADGKILVTSDNLHPGAGESRASIVRLNADGTKESGFNPVLKKDGAVVSPGAMALQAGRRILIGGRFDEVNGQVRTNLVRLNADGLIDAEFNPEVTGEAEHPDGTFYFAAQSDGKILAAENCAWCAGALVRLNANGRRDSSFAPLRVDYGPQAMAIQEDGKIVIAGFFATVAGQPRTNIARLHSDGTLDTAFNPGADGPVNPILLQADGKILVAGIFTTLAGHPRTNIARLNTDGTVDATFNAAVDSWVHSLALQTDGKIILGGQFSVVNGQRRIGLARLNPDGTLDDEFDPGVDGLANPNGSVNRLVWSLALQADGKILVGGVFTVLGGQPRRNIGRLNNTDAATQSLSYDSSAITWLRGGTSPEVWRTEFESSSDGMTWAHLGAGVRIPGGWRLGDISVAKGATIRARGFVPGSGESEAIVESTMCLIDGPPTFTKITTGPITSTAGRTFGTAWVDLDGDGDLDLYVSNADGPNLLYRNEGQGVFTRISTGAIANTGAGSFSASWADINNDGHMDLYIARQSAAGLLFTQQTDGTFRQSTVASTSIQGTAWGDFDRDGFVDLLVTDNSSGAPWRNNGQGSLSAVTGAGMDVSGDAITWADYDGDGDLDVFVAEGPFSGGGTCRLYRNDGLGVFTRITHGELVERSTFVTAAAWGDYDNDGFLDLFLPRANSGQSLPSFLFHNDGDGTFTQVEQSPFTDDTGFSISCSWADYDNDGWLDLFVADRSGTGANRLYRNQGDGTFERVLSGSIASDLGQCAGSSWGDYDRDGFLDLFVAASLGAGSPNQPNDYLYHNDGNGNAWITIKCVGTRSNRSSIGAKVRAKATINGKTFWQLREINTGDGWSGNPLEAHFGLGNATNVETLRIEWPSGTVQELQKVAAKQLLTVTEPARFTASLSNGAPQIVLHGGRNLRYDIQVSTGLKTWSSLSTITITNLDGTAIVEDTNIEPIGRFYRAVLR